ncbi:hypothetical protein ABOM_003027 [Aspergillus bombycis]|uniref:Uncharacterized protein n=1 Tax=Aspergillus bombycis TaxID=109264 RepID=A0A1F8AAU2_9EURO|nr:hypothetical protein ABOM_003027 [Aspergillus bombycis]OGM48830.1 hypothetical protein ABOM_003027 [Aspergillus bombycis]
MSNDLEVWVQPKPKRIEGHTAQCTLTFNGRVIFGPRHCHNNTYKLRDALAAADPRFQLTLTKRRHSKEGHTYSISVKAGGIVYLDRMSTHGHMKELCQAINKELAAERARAESGKPELAPPSQGLPPPLPPQQPPGSPPPQATRPKGRQDFEIAIICALKVESNAIEAFLDEEFEVDGFSYGQAPGDSNTYTIGRIGQRAVVLAYMANMGKVGSTRAATQLHLSFPQIKAVFLVGICGAAPQDAQGRETFLGDYSDRFRRKDTLEDTLGRGNYRIRSFLSKLECKNTSSKLEQQTRQYIAELSAKDGEYAYPGANHDVLYRADYRHKHQNGDPSVTCVECNTADDTVCKEARESSCDSPDGLGCSSTQLVRRRQENTHPVLHFGHFSSGDSVMKSGLHRDEIVARDKVIAFEMEGAGVWDVLPTVIIKSACDYADSHKNKTWQSYAAGTAAACTRAVLDQWRSSQGAWF